jgi:Leucine-rich repeat (LRR) protein
MIFVSLPRDSNGENLQLQMEATSVSAVVSRVARESGVREDRIGIRPFEGGDPSYNLHFGGPPLGRQESLQKYVGETLEAFVLPTEEEAFVRTVLNGRDRGSLSYDVLKNIHNFNVSRIRLGKIPEGAFQALTQLETISLFEVAASLPKSLGLVSQLRYLRLRRSQVTQLPDEICKLSRLQNLDLCENAIVRLPETFGELSSLEYCFLNTNVLDEMPDSFGKLPVLKHLEVRQNQLGVHGNALKREFAQLSMLRHLDLSENRLMMLPGGFDKLTSLQHLDLSANRLQAMCDLDKLVDLTFLDLSSNQLARIPDIRNPKLRHLNLSYNPGVETWRGDVATFKRLPALQELLVAPFDDSQHIASWMDKWQKFKFDMDLRLFSIRRRCGFCQP